MSFSILLSLIIAILSITFAFQNNETIFVKFFDYEIAGSVALIIISSVIVGVIIGLLVLLPSVLNKGSRLRRLEKENTKLKKEISNEAIQYETEGLGEDSIII